MTIGWVAFLLDRWLLPQGSFVLEAWLTLVGAFYIVVGIMALRGSRLGTSAMPWMSLLLMVWGILALLGLSADNVSSRTWMWSSLFAAVLGTATFLLGSLPIDRPPRPGTLVLLAFLGFLGLAAWLQISRCRLDIHASWCDPRYEQEDRIVATVSTDRRPRNSGHIGGVLGPAFASFIFEEPPDPTVDVVPLSATLELTDDPNLVKWHFGGEDALCVGQSLVQSAVGGYEIRFSVDCRP